jgi:hypothetical protein
MAATARGVFGGDADGDLAEVLVAAGAVSDAARSSGAYWKPIGRGQTSGTTGRTYASWYVPRRITRVSGGRE